jgi:hypothetical protein
MLAIDNAINTGEFGTAAAGLDRLLAFDDLVPADRYMLLGHHYRLAEAVGDARLRETRLAAMVDSGLMPADERPAALRSLVAMALAAGSDVRATARLVELLAMTPDDARAHANLAALHQRAGRSGDARIAMRNAIAAAERHGDPVPDDWRALVANN